MLAVMRYSICYDKLTWNFISASTEDAERPAPLVTPFGEFDIVGRVYRRRSVIVMGSHDCCAEQPDSVINRVLKGKVGKMGRASSSLRK